MTEPGGIVWLASFPKSGNTWFRIFLANLSAGANGPADINDLDEPGGMASGRREFETETMLDSGLLSYDEIDRLRPRVYEAIAAAAPTQRWIKAHDAWTLTLDGEPLLGRHAAKAAVYLVRDPRDVAVSMAHHNDRPIDDAIRSMSSPTAAMCAQPEGQHLQLRQKLLDWSGHVTSWIEQTDVPVHVVRYEDLVANPVEHFGAALEFAGRSATVAEIERAVRYSEFAELQRQEREKGFAERVSRTAPFFRSGRVGAWREALTREEAEVIESCHGSVMARFGYALTADKMAV